MKATKAEIAQRVNEILEIRLAGARFHDIVQYASEKQWGVGERQLWNYVRASDERLAQTLEPDRERLLSRHLGQRQYLYAHAVSAGDYRAALSMLRDEAELQGLYPPAKVKAEHTGAKGGPIQHEVSADHEHRHQHALDPAALAAFRGDLVAAGLGDLLPDGGTQPVDTPPAAPQAAAVPPAQRNNP